MVESLARGLGALPVASLMTDPDQRIQFANASFATMTGYGLKDVIGQNCRLLQGPDTDPAAVSEIRRALSERSQYRGVILNYRKDGSAFWNLLAIAPFYGEDGVLEHYVSAQVDVSAGMTARLARTAALEDAEAQRRTTESLLQVAQQLGRATSGEVLAETISRAVQDLAGADQAAVGVLDDRNARLRFVAVSGMPEPLARAALAYELSPSESAVLAEQLIAPSPRLVTRTSFDWAGRTPGALENSTFVSMPVVAAGRLRAVLLAVWADTPAPRSISPDLERRLEGLAGLMAVSLETVRLLEQVRQAAEVDGLTGLMSRPALERAVAEALTAREAGEHVAVLYADVDRFKRINDGLGHGAGDEVLRRIGSAVRSAVRSSDRVARVGGDEIVVLLPRVRDLQEAETIRDRIHALCRSPIDLAGRKIVVRMSVGLALSGDATEGESGSEAAGALLQRADAAMYEIKRARPVEPVVDPAIDLLELDVDLHGAAERGEIRTYFQPIVEANTRRVIAHEALVRWDHPRYGLLLPEQFLPLAEENGAIDTLERAVIADASHFCARTRHLAVGIAVNVSRRHLLRDDFTDYLIKAVSRRSVPTSRLTVEVTESDLITDLPKLLRQLERLRAEGIGVSIDDFGTGYSSLSQLQDLPVTQVKIDRGFVRRGGAVGQSVIRVIVELAASLGLRVVAEGVETEEQAVMLEEAGCHCLQGFLFGVPLPADESFVRLTR